ncbi:FAD-dependent monooxygenase [Streptomyces sp. NBC_01012]|uniref:FAD-dependent monooxygenase n=1 Tax=Streptomyces sp. NBC_01012 TaxID=2903717 RepID=UPI00386BF73B|nr:FAD-dependent monooxygenase [Streptomyces sp. NBC_01012]
MEHVVIAGAGPTGLWLAAELRLAGTPVTVLESRHEPDPHSKALTLHPRTLEILAFRGVVDPFLAEGRRIPSGHFGGLDNRMDFGVLDTPYPFTLALPQARTEELLEAHAKASGVGLRRGHQVTGLTQDEDGVTLEATGPEGPYTLRAAYAVGCDGTRSTVREAAGIGFPGTDATTWGWLGDVTLDAPPEGATYAASGPRGGVMVVPMPGGIHRIVGGDPDSNGPEHPGELTLDALRAKVTRIAGTDFGMRDPRWLSRFGNATRQAATYREGRVLLAGDAAHMHYPAGGVGLNVGLQDATNLGWKLAATLAGTAPDGLLDSYHTERHPVGADLLLSTRAQTALMNAQSPEGQDLRTLLGQLIVTVPEFSRSLAERLSALAVTYPAPAPRHPLTGHRSPNLRLGGGTDLFTLLRTGRHVLLNFSGTPTPPSTPHVITHTAPEPDPRPAWSTVRAALVRPDGHIAWASEQPDAEALRAEARAATSATHL